MIRLPAEWEPQSAVLIAWPHDSGDFASNLESVERSYTFIAKTISQYQPLIIVCRDDDHQIRIRKLLGSNANTVYIQAILNDIWTRDTGFITVEENGQSILLNFRFNGWGEKYPHHEDDALNHKLLPHVPFIGATHKDIDFILEGGSIESDGAGTILTTRQCLLNPNRNQWLTQKEIENRLLEYLGAERILWVEQEHLPGDDTDAHIDTLARFCSPDTIAYTSCDNHRDPLYAGLKRMESQLEALRTIEGKPYRLVALPLPENIYDEDGKRLPANYANFLIINDAVMAPTYDESGDQTALERIAQCFPGRKVIPTPCRPLVYQNGSLHCMTMQFPLKALLFPKP
jgi:agmatine/peptidylarginine deiminase